MASDLAGVDKSARMMNTGKSEVDDQELHDAVADDLDDIYNAAEAPKISQASLHVSSAASTWCSPPSVQSKVTKAVIPGLGLLNSAVHKNGTLSNKDTAVTVQDVKPYTNNESSKVPDRPPKPPKHEAYVGKAGFPQSANPNEDLGGFQNPAQAQSSNEVNTISIPAEVATYQSSRILSDSSAEAPQNEDAEWEFDSESDSSDDTSSSSAESTQDDDQTPEDEEESDEEGVLLDAEEQAQMLIRDDAGSDDGLPSGGRLRTANELPEENYEKPNVVITPTMTIHELGKVETIIENVILVKATCTGEYQVLESGSVVCMQDRTLVGAIAETLGRVHQPMYAIGFAKAAEIKELGIETGITLYYVAELSKHVFTQPLKAHKGTDASNLHDEETGDAAPEFSDDEAEAAYKQAMKKGKLFKTGPNIQPSARAPKRKPSANPIVENHNKSEESRLNYDEMVDDDMYTPLQRPRDLHQAYKESRKEPLEEVWLADQVDRFRRGRGRGGRGGGTRSRGNEQRHGGRSGRGPPTSDYGHGRHNHRTITHRPDQYTSNNVHQVRRDASTIQSASPYSPFPQSQTAYPGQVASFPMAQQTQTFLPQTGSVPTSNPLGQSHPGEPLATFTWTLPASAYLNPAFFQSQLLAQVSAQSLQPQPGNDFVNPTLDSSAMQSPTGTFTYAHSATTPINQYLGVDAAHLPQSGAAVMAVQEQLNILRGLNGTIEPPGPPRTLPTS